MRRSCPPQAIGQHGAAALLKAAAAAAAAAGRSPSEGGKLRVLTHCNTGALATAAYGTALGVVRALAAEGKLEHAYCTETRPYNQGACRFKCRMEAGRGEGASSGAGARSPCVASSMWGRGAPVACRMHTRCRGVCREWGGWGGDTGGAAGNAPARPPARHRYCAWGEVERGLCPVKQAARRTCADADV